MQKNKGNLKEEKKSHEEFEVTSEETICTLIIKIQHVMIFFHNFLLKELPCD